MLIIKDLEKKYRDKKVLNSLNYEFREGIYGILGPNGAGKTTRMKCITGLCSYSGDISFDNNKKISPIIGYLPQIFKALPELTVREYLDYLTYVRNIHSKETNKDIDNILDVVNLKSQENQKTYKISGGMMRRLGVAQALLGNPDIVLLDEPTTGLDPEERLRFKLAIKQICKKKSIIISTHIVEDINSMCDQVIIMKDGNILASGTCEEIKKHADNKVFLVKQDLCEKDFQVVKMVDIKGKIYARIISSDLMSSEKDDENRSFVEVEPDIEDGYICILEDI